MFCLAASAFFRSEGKGKLFEEEEVADPDSSMHPLKPWSLAFLDY